jgi:hypothetical protein
MLSLSQSQPNPKRHERSGGPQAVLLKKKHSMLAMVCVPVHEVWNRKNQNG